MRLRCLPRLAPFAKPIGPDGAIHVQGRNVLTQTLQLRGTKGDFRVEHYLGFVAGIIGVSSRPVRIARMARY
jgi:hypothetical protein